MQQGFFEQQIVLTCGDCGEKLVLFGPEEDWRARHAVFVWRTRAQAHP